MGYVAQNWWKGGNKFQLNGLWMFRAIVKGVMQQIRTLTLLLNFYVAKLNVPEYWRTLTVRDLALEFDSII